MVPINDVVTRTTIQILWTFEAEIMFWIMGMGLRKLQDPVMADTCRQGSGSRFDLRDLRAGRGDDLGCFPLVDLVKTWESTYPDRLRACA